jgi:hypothetical protein
MQKLHIPQKHKNKNKIKCIGLVMGLVDWPTQNASNFGYSHWTLKIELV